MNLTCDIRELNKKLERRLNKMDIQQIKVSQMNSPRSGHPVANQFVIRVKSNDKDQAGFDSVYFQSYQTIIAVRDYQGNVTLDVNDWNYSRTTRKYRNEFLGENTQETRKKIKDGTYKLADLN